MQPGSCRQVSSIVEDRATGRSQLEGKSGEDTPEITYWGHSLTPNKSSQHLRIGFANIRGLGLSFRSHKNTELYSFITNYSFDIFGTAENNVNWPAVPVQNRAHERSRGWWKCRHFSLGFSCNDPAMRTIRHQFGGTAVWSRDVMVHRVAASGHDRLGRWAWTRFRGQNGRWLRVVSAYRPCESQEPNSVFQQHLRLLPSSAPEPRQAFLTDLENEARLWLDAGDALIIMMDANDNVLFGAVPTMFRRLHLVNLLYQDPSFLRNNTPLPTCKRAEPIDAIFGSPSLQLLRWGYTAPGEHLTTDHSTLWIDLPLASVFGNNVPAHLPLSSPHRLTCQDPRVVARYNNLFYTYLHEHNLIAQAYRLQEQMFSIPPSALQQQFDRLDATRLRGMKHSEAHCRKLRMGATRYTPEYSSAGKTATAW